METSTPEGQTSNTATIHHNRRGCRNGKVARLTKAIRDQINIMIQDGVPYLKIIERLGPDGQDLNEDALTTWKGGGYEDWLRDNDLAEVIARKYELAVAVTEKTSSGTLPASTVLHALAANLCEFMIETDPQILRRSVLSDSDKFTRLVNSMVRLAEGTIKCDEHKMKVEELIASAAKQNKDAKPGISPEALRQAEEALKLL
jgi:hypothetical protein